MIRSMSLKSASAGGPKLSMMGVLLTPPGATPLKRTGHVLDGEGLGEQLDGALDAQYAAEYGCPRSRPSTRCSQWRRRVRSSPAARTAHEEGAREVDGDHPVPPDGDCSVVWAKPPTPAMLHRLVMAPSSSARCETAAVTPSSSVTSQRTATARPPASAASRSDLLRHRCDGVLGHVEAGHRTTLGRQPPCRGPTDSRARARDERDPPRGNDRASPPPECASGGRTARLWSWGSIQAPSCLLGRRSECHDSSRQGGRR